MQQSAVSHDVTARCRIVPNLVPRSATDAALRRLYLEVRHHGVTADEVRDWEQATWFPWLRWEPEILSTRPDARVLGLDYVEWGEPQIVFELPAEEQDWPMVPHVDTPPPWAEGREYVAIVGVALTDQMPENGSLRVWDGGAARALSMSAGDGVVMAPDLPHSGYLNLTATPRVVIYHRALRLP